MLPAPPPPDPPPADPSDRRRQDPEGNRRTILAAARQEFAEHGLNGARVDAIAARTNTVKRMIYYYFGSKQGLYLAVLEDAYADLRHLEGRLHLDALSPAEAIAHLIDVVFDHDEANPDFIRLVLTENMHNARHIAGSMSIRAINRTMLALLTQVLDRGKADGLFRNTVQPTDIHLLISSFCFFRVSNRATFWALFDVDLGDPAARARHRRMLIAAVLHTLGYDRPMSYDSAAADADRRPQTGPDGPTDGTASQAAPSNIRA